ncbi:Rhodanese-like domain-containing protein [Apiosordaria backusii]|uniref:Rhodanese-like domain-containing protein n=1 Tax=Apiosordaria backusii TaxID=314023 RepID=A0AA40E363_9PEZI|nr:Rhodanese-like domain-containing protein [Apiosordaria backusii]
MPTIASLQRLPATTLSALLLDSSSNPSSIAIIDVRDDDYIGGHIRGALNFPSQTLDATLPTLVRKLEDKETVVFHCALSQQRGPTAALRYLREKERLAKLDQRQQQEQQEQQEGDEEEEKKKKKPVVDQKVYVLDKGFVGWQEVYGEDERLTEGYRKELWKDGYWM